MIQILRENGSLGEVPFVSYGALIKKISSRSVMKYEEWCYKPDYNALVFKLYQTNGIEFVAVDVSEIDFAEYDKSPIQYKRLKEIKDGLY